VEKRSPQALETPIRSSAPAEDSEPGNQSELFLKTLGLGLVVMTLPPKPLTPSMSLFLFLGQSLLVGHQRVLLQFHLCYPGSQRRLGFVSLCQIALSSARARDMSSCFRARARSMSRALMVWSRIWISFFKVSISDSKSSVRDTSNSSSEPGTAARLPWPSEQLDSQWHPGGLATRQPTL
jgi:hypothetical protein